MGDLEDTMRPCRKRCLHSAPASRHQPCAHPHCGHLWPLCPRSGPRVNLSWGWPGGQGRGPNCPERAVSLGIPAEIWERCRLPLSGLPVPPPTQCWAPGPSDGMPPCSSPSPPRLQGKPEPPSNETQAGLAERLGFLLTPSSHRQPHIHQGHLGDADDSAVLQAHSPSSCDPRAGAFSYLTDHCGPWSLGHPGQGGRGAALRLEGATAAASLHPRYSPPTPHPQQTPPAQGHSWLGSGRPVQCY